LTARANNGVDRHTLSQDTRIRSYLPGDEQDIANLLLNAFSGWPDIDVVGTALDYWRWKYSDAPVRAPIISVCESRDGIVGCDHSISLRVKVGKKVRLCDYSCDTVVHADYRGKGLSKVMIEHSNDLRKSHGFHLVFWVTRNPIFIEAYSKIRPSFPYQIRNLVHIQDVGLHLKYMPMEKAWFMRLGFHLAKGVNSIRNAFRRYSTIDGYIITRSNGFDERINDFWDELSGYYDFIVERRLEYLNWKYCDKRGGKYQFLFAENGDRILGYCVLCVNRRRIEYPVGYIVDLLVIPERLDVAFALARNALAYFRAQDVNIVNCLAIHGNQLEGVLHKAGFLYSRVRLNFFYNTMGDPDFLSQVLADRAHFSFGDIDSLPSGYARV